MKTLPRTRRGRPRTSALTRNEQLRAAKRAQRARERKAGLAAVQLRMPAEEAERLRVAAQAADFHEALDEFLGEMVVDMRRYPRLRELAWNRADRWVPAQEALALYERNWRFVEPGRLGKDEARLIDRLKDRFGGGVINA
jgi:hypothetical protein